MKSFIEFSQRIGKNLAYIQGRGGNISYKKGNTIFIKASGAKLKEIQKNNGIVGCNILLIRSFLMSKKNKKNDLLLNEIVDNAITTHEDTIKPSIEIGMHIVLPSTYVLHTHSVYVNVFACLKSPEKLLRKILNKYSFTIIPYKNPGYELTAYLLKMQKKSSLPPILILKNHGLLIHSNSLRELKTIHTYINETLQKITGEYRHEKQTNMGKIPLIIPDAAVYYFVQRQNISSETRSEIDELSRSLSFVVNTIKKMNKKIAYLSNKNIRYILAMQREKLRMKAIHQK